MRPFTTALDLLGAAAITTGAALIYAPAGFLIGGAALLAASWHLSPRPAAVVEPDEVAL